MDQSANLCSWTTDNCLLWKRAAAARVLWACQTEVSTPADAISVVVHL